MTAIDELRAGLRGDLVDPTDPGYDQARKVYNAMHDRRPALIAQCADAADVVACVHHAREHDLEIAVRGGGHGVPGFGTCDGGLVIDLSPLDNVHVDPARKVARVGGGTTVGGLDHATHAYGLATTGGTVSTTGMTGLTLGGGFGHLTRGCGLAIDNLVSADVVTADGRLVTASDYQHEDLFWALRGGGGNFGVVTSMELQLHECATVVGGPLFYEPDDAGAVMDLYRTYIAEAPEQMSCFFGWQIAPPLPFVPGDRVGDLFAGMVLCWNGPVAEADRVLAPFHEVAEVKAGHVGPMPYPALNSAFDALVPAGLREYWKADFVTELTDEAIAAHIEHGKKTPVLTSTTHLYPINGAAHRVGADETAFGHRDKNFVAVVLGTWADPADDERITGWVRDYYAAIHPFSGSEGGSINFQAADDDRVEANYGSNFRRLAEAKAAWDPDNLFHLNQNITPA